MDEENSEFKDDSSFEVLETTDEDDYSTSSSLWSSTLPENFFGTMADSFSSEPMIEKADDNFKPGIDMTARSIDSTISNLPLHFQLQTEYCQRTDINTYENQVNENAFPGDTVSCGSKLSLENNSIPDGTNFIITRPKSEMIIHTDFETYETAAFQYQPIEKTEIFMGGNSNIHQLAVDNNTLVKNFTSDTENQRFNFHNPENPQEIQSNSNNLTLMKRSENEAVQMYPYRQNCSRKNCPVIQRGLKIYEWISNQCIQNLVTGAQSSIRSFFNTLELGMNSMLAREDPLIILIIADVVDSMAIEEAFNKSLGGRVVAWRCQIEEASVTPVLPVGHYEAFQAIQFKIEKARQLHDLEKKTIMVSAASFIAEVFCHRWQMGSILCLEDPHLQLNLHNFTSTVPVPNEYIHYAEALTPEDYPLREKGLAITLEEVIEYTTKTETKDVQEFLTGVNRVTSLKSAAEVLAGMYKKYCKRFI